MLTSFKTFGNSGVRLATWRWSMNQGPSTHLRIVRLRWGLAGLAILLNGESVDSRIAVVLLGSGLFFAFLEYVYMLQATQKNEFCSFVIADEMDNESIGDMFSYRVATEKGKSKSAAWELCWSQTTNSLACQSNTNLNPGVPPILDTSTAAARKEGFDF
ncbi:hypothetical protein Ddye_018890 [Dipteronia dyeriana]|uniref:Uncharacterized protein n=1 Tax=Dipteronia dyeriana TaxID=168575 RepID=A0AAD9WVH0_9ROSI|nr:hypothetical protein Ddye_018890 [Dipteronia dyeriana]